MKLTKLFPAFLFCMFVSAGALAAKEEVPQSIEGTTRVSAEDVIELAGSKDDLVIIDARKPSDYEKGHLEGAVNLPNTETTPESLAKLLPSKDTPVVFYCNGIRCGRSVDSAKIAVSAGYTNVYWFRGGIEEWQEKGYPVVNN